MGIGAHMHCSEEFANYLRLSQGWKEDRQLGWFGAGDLCKTSPSLTYIFYKTITIATAAIILLSVGYVPSALDIVSLILKTTKY